MSLSALVCIPMRPELRSVLEAAPNLKVDFAPERPDKNALAAAVAQYDALLLGVKEELTEAMLEGCPKTSFVGTASIGHDHLADSWARHAMIVDAAGVNAPEVAEHAVWLLAAGLRDLSKQLGQADLGKRVVGRSVRGARIGIVGAGATAVATVRLVTAYGGKAKVWTRSPERHPEVLEEGASFAEAEELFAWADAVSLHLPLTEDTKGFVNGTLLDAMSQGCLLVNVARSQVVDHQALLRTLDSGHLAAYLSDVEDVTYPLRDRVLRHPRVTVTPHLAGITEESVERMQRHLVDALIMWAQNHMAGLSR
jgi:phosphoglycerate dehydrogenase-like enzyme